MNPPSPGNAHAPPQVDPTAYVRILLRRRWFAIGVFAVVVIGAALWTVRQPRIFRATTSVIIDATAPRFLDEQVQEVVESGTGNYWYNKEYYETQYKVIVSRAVSQRVVDKLGLSSDLSFLGLEGLTDPARRQQALAGADAVSRLQSRIKVQPVKDSRLVYVHVDDVDAARAALLSSEVAEAYIAETLALKMRASESASRWLEERLRTLSDQSQQSELAVYQFRKSADMLEASLEDRQSMVSQRLNAFSQALTEVRTRIAGLQARVRAIEELKAESRQPDWAAALPTVVDNRLVQELKISFSAQRAECAELEERYLAGHPKLVACLDRLAAVRGNLQSELDNMVRAAQADLAEAKNKEQNLGSLFASAKAEAFEVNKKQIDFERLKRDADNNQRLHELVLKRLKEIELSGLLRTSNARILDLARAPLAPVSPNVQLTLLFALVLGLLGGIGVAMLAELLDTRITSQEQVEEWLGVTFLGILPSIPKTKEGKPMDLVMHLLPKSAVAECCRAIRTNLLFMSPDRPMKTVLVTSSGPEDGKTTTAINLATALAESGQKVLLIDGDMRRPRVHRAFGVPNGIGLSTLILGEAKLDDCLKSTDVTNLSVLTCGPVPPNPAELLHTAAFSQLLKQLGERFDKVLIDSPPVGAVADAVVLGTQVDGTVVVLKTGKTSRELARRTVRTLRDVNARLFGAVLNDLDLENRSYRAYYYYAHYGYDRKDGSQAEARS